MGDIITIFTGGENDSERTLDFEYAVKIAVSHNGRPAVKYFVPLQDRDKHQEMKDKDAKEVVKEVANCEEDGERGC